MNNQVLDFAFEEKLARLITQAEEVCDGNNPELLRTTLDDPEIQNWLTAMRNANRAPFKRFFTVR